MPDQTHSRLERSTHVMLLDQELIFRQETLVPRIDEVIEHFDLGRLRDAREVANSLLPKRPNPSAILLGPERAARAMSSQYENLRRTIGRSRNA
jgi:hypothetical protein